MNRQVQKEVEDLIQKLNLTCSAKEFQDKVDWTRISRSQKLSEGFIREFKDKVNWVWISRSQKLSEDFIREFQDKVDWFWISQYQKLSEEFRKEVDHKIKDPSYIIPCINKDTNIDLEKEHRYNKLLEEANKLLSRWVRNG